MSKILIDREVMQQALEALEAGADVDPIFAGQTEDALRAALAEPVQEPVPPKTAWAHLPNAAHIDRILAHLKAHPDKWHAAFSRGTAWAAVRVEARVAAWGAVSDNAAARDVVWGAARVAARVAARDAISALIAWDDAGELLSQPIEKVKARADEGDPAAVLIFPAMLAMREEK